MQLIVASILSKCPRPFTGAGFRFVDCAKATDNPIVSRKRTIERSLKVRPFFKVLFCSESSDGRNNQFSRICSDPRLGALSLNFGLLSY